MAKRTIAAAQGARSQSLLILVCALAIAAVLALALVEYLLT